MNTEQLLKDYLSEKDITNLVMEDKSILYAVMELYRQTEEKRYCDALDSVLTSILDSNHNILKNYLNMEHIFFGNILMNYYEITGEMKYKEAMKEYYNLFWTYVEHKKEEGVFVNDNYELEFYTLYQSIPFIMNYETKYNNKEKYVKIISILSNVRDAYFNEDCNLYTSIKGLSVSDLWKDRKVVEGNLYLLYAFIHSFEGTSEEIYEYYRKLKDLFKELLAGMIPCMEHYKEVEFVNLFLYSMKKACDLGVLLAEKYKETIERFLMSINGASNSYSSSGKVGF